MRTSAFLIRVLICFILSMIPLNELESQIYSTRLKVRGPRKPSPNILILNLESEDFAEIKREYAHATDSRGEPWSSAGVLPAAAESDKLEGLRDLAFWDPGVFRETLRRILAQDPASVAITWYIPSEIVESLSDPGIELLAKNKKVIWSAQFDSEGKFLKPAASLSTKTNYGFNNLRPDGDGMMRRATLARQSYPSLARAAQVRTQAKTENISANNASEEPYLINYMGPAGTVTFCRLKDFLGGRAQGVCADLKDKIVLLSREADRPVAEPLSESVGTFHRTPLGEMSRAEIIANQIDTVVNRHGIYEASIIERTLFILAMVAGAAFYIIYYPVVISAIAVTGTGIVFILVLFQLVFQLFDFYIPTANAALALLITYLVFTGYRLAFQENLQWRSLKQAQYLRELDQMKTNFLSLVSHDLKTPLAKIQAVVERLKREGQAPKDLVDSIENSNNELKHYITSILNLSKIESQKVILNIKSNDINRIIEQVLKRLRPLAQNKNITIEEALDPLFSVECDEDLIRQVLTNLVDNAIKYSPAGLKVIVRSKEEEGFIRVEVEDFGLGIPKDQLPLMFRKFGRFVRPMKEQVKGTGLGLYLSKYFIELHGGRIRVKSEEGKGTIFTFTLPLNGAEAETLLG